MTTSTAGLPAASEATVASLERHARELAAAVAAGALVGFVVNGWGSRLAMMLLARLNPQVTGRISDDGFRMGQLTAETVGLVGFGTVVGILGGIVYLAIRNLRFGPRWFRVASMTVGPAVVVGNMLVHTDGIDFRVLEPTVLAIALFVALPGLFALALSAVVDRWTADGAWFRRGGRWRLLFLAPLVPLFPLLAFAVPTVAVMVANDTNPEWRHVAGDARLAWAARLLLVAVFAVSLVDLTGKVVELT